MRTVAIYNMKGGVGKTTTAVNLSYLAAQSGQRILLWDLDPQAASSFAFRIRPHVSGFGKRSLENGDAFSTAVKQTDYDNLCLLPADFAYHKFDRLLSSHGNRERLFTSLLETIGREFDIVFLDCPAGFSRLTQAILAAADTILAPTIPTVLSLRTIAQMVEQADRSRSRSTLAVVFNMVDRRKTLHRRVRELAAAHTDIFLSAEIPYASVVEQMGARRMPTPAFAAHEQAARAFGEVWVELQTRLRQEEGSRGERRWAHVLDRIESLIKQLESTDRPLSVPSVTTAVEERSSGETRFGIVHLFDTDQRDLKRRGQVLELHERNGSEFVVVARSDTSALARESERADARIDRSWTVQILAGEMSPLDALERRIGRPLPLAVEQVRASVGGRRLRRVDTCQSIDAAAEETARLRTIAAPASCVTIAACPDDSRIDPALGQTRYHAARS